MGTFNGKLIHFFKWEDIPTKCMWFFKCTQQVPDPRFPTPEPQNLEVDKLYVFWKRRSTDFKALKLWKGR